jgi:hypothetical protein
VPAPPEMTAVTVRDRPIVPRSRASARIGRDGTMGRTMRRSRNAANVAGRERGYIGMRRSTQRKEKTPARALLDGGLRCSAYLAEVFHYYSAVRTGSTIVAIKAIPASGPSSRAGVKGMIHCPRIKLVKQLTTRDTRNVYSATGSSRRSSPLDRKWPRTGSR